MAAKGSNRWDKAAHIKKGTQGSFNQISMDVLDAASQAVTNEQGEAPRKLLGVIPLFTLSKNGRSTEASVASKTLLKTQGDDTQASIVKESKKAASETPSAPKHSRPKGQSLSMLAKTDAGSLEPYEVRAAEKRSARVRRRILIGILVAVLAAGFISYVAYALYNNHQYQQSQVAIVDQALSQIVDADKDITKLNDALADPTGEGTKEQLESLIKTLPQAKITLQRAKSLIERGAEGLQDNYSQEVAARAQKAVAARETMVEEGQKLATRIVAALEAEQTLDAAWEKIIQADSEARGASSLLLTPNASNLEASQKGTQSAISLLDQASGILSGMPSGMDLDISPYQEYVEKRKAALQAARTAIAALASEDTEAAKAAQEAYSQADTLAANLAGKLPQKPSDFVFQKYQEQAQETIDSYSQARTAAGIADSMLREYFASQRK